MIGPMADKWEYRTAEAGTFKLDRLLALGWEPYTATEPPSDDEGPRGLAPPAPGATVIHLRRKTGYHS
jgi:hypothetical protein